MLLTLGLGAFSLPGPVPAVKGDQVSKPEAARLTDGFNRARGSLLPVDVSSKPQRERLVESLLMPMSKAEHLIELVERGERMIGWLALWDNFDEDGDVASVTAAGFTQIVPLRHAPTKMPMSVLGRRPFGSRAQFATSVALELTISIGALACPS